MGLREGEKRVATRKKSWRREANKARDDSKHEGKNPEWGRRKSSHSRSRNRTLIRLNPLHTGDDDL